MTAIIDIRELQHRYGELEALKGVSLRVEAGSFFALLGPNGAGKTTLVHILCSLLPPTAGQALVAGFDVRRQARSVRRQLGLVFQEPSLDDRLTVFENLAFHARLYRVPRRERAKRIWEMLELVELTDWANAVVATLSRGMKRRLEIGRAVLHRPRLLVLDEPTTGLDVQSRRRIWAYLRRLLDEAGVSLLLTTHQIEEAEGADLVAILDRGEVQALDSPARLRQSLGGQLVGLRLKDPALEQGLQQRFDGDCWHHGGALWLRTTDSGALIRELSGDGSLWPQVEGLQVVDPTLEEVFVQLTGRELRDSAADPRAMLHAFAQRGGEHTR